MKILKRKYEMKQHICKYRMKLKERKYTLLFKHSELKYIFVFSTTAGESMTTTELSCNLKKNEREEREVREKGGVVK